MGSWEETTATRMPSSAGTEPTNARELSAKPAPDTPEQHANLARRISVNRVLETDRSPEGLFTSLGKAGRSEKTLWTRVEETWRSQATGTGVAGSTGGRSGASPVAGVRRTARARTTSIALRALRAAAAVSGSSGSTVARTFTQ